MPLNAVRKNAISLKEFKMLSENNIIVA